MVHEGKINLVIYKKNDVQWNFLVVINPTIYIIKPDAELVMMHACAISPGNILILFKMA